MPNLQEAVLSFEAVGAMTPDELRDLANNTDSGKKVYPDELISALLCAADEIEGLRRELEKLRWVEPKDPPNGMGW